MSAIFQISQVFGYHTDRTAKNDKGSFYGGNYDSYNITWDAKNFNITNLLGYFPGIALMSTIVRFVGILWAMKTPADSSDMKAFNITMFIRGGIEGIGAGLLFLLPDLIVSFNRHLYKKSRAHT